MEDIIHLSSRDYTQNYLRKVPGTKRTYRLVSSVLVMNTGILPEGLFIDPSGGPLIAPGVVLGKDNNRVKSVEVDPEGYYDIIFE